MSIRNLQQLSPLAIAARVRKSATQAITTATWTRVTWNTEDYDTATLHDTSTNTERFTVSVAGLFVITAQATLENVVTGSRFLAITKNGASPDQDQGASSSSLVQVAALSPRLHVSTQLKLAVSDYVEAWVWHDRGSNLNVLTTNSFFEIAYLGRI